MSGKISRDKSEVAKKDINASGKSSSNKMPDINMDDKKYIVTLPTGKIDDRNKNKREKAVNIPAKLILCDLICFCIDRFINTPF